MGKNYYGVAVGFVLLAAALAAHAADVLTLVASGAVSHDTNVFKRPTATPDTLKTGSVGLRIDKEYSRQRFQLDASASAYRHTENPSLDFDGVDYHAAWLWALTSRVTGSIYSDRSEGQVPFVDFQQTVQNIRVTTNRGLTGDALLRYGFHLVAGASRSEQQSTAVFLAQPDFRLDSIQGGVKFVRDSGTSLTLLKRTGDGLYTKRDFDPLLLLDTRYKQNETEFQADWLPAAKSSLLFRVSHYERRHEHLSQLDSYGNGGELSFGWNPTGKLGLAVSARRDVTPYFDLQTTHRVDRTLSFAPRWQVDTKIGLSLAAQRTQTDFLGNVATLSGEPRHDNYGFVQLSLAWTPNRNVALDASAQRMRRSSNEPTAIFDATITRFSAKLTF